MRAKKVAKKVIKIAEKRPDFVYTDQKGSVAGENCSYVGSSEENPEVGEGCIVGQALMKLGVRKEELLEVEGQGAFEVVRDFGFGGGNEKYLRFLEHVQELQDAGSSWGDAVASARKAYDV